MVTRIRSKGVKPRLYLKEHREALGVSAEAMAGRLGIERESVYRWERELNRVTPEKQAAYADALNLRPEELWRLPGRKSLDALIASAPEEIQAMATDIVRRLVSGAK